MSNSSNGSGFALTRWTLVAKSRGDSPEAKAALRELCDAYYAPVVAFLRREGNDDDAARELAHEFFAKLLSSDSIGSAERSRGRFRSYLLGSVKHFLMNQRRDSMREKRGGGVVHVPIDSRSDTSQGIEVADNRVLPADAIFDREWALAIIDRALVSLEIEFTSTGNASSFEVLKPWISSAGASQSQADAAAALGMTEGALKVAIHRLRQRFRELVRRDIAHTLDDPADLDAEMQHLVAALALQIA